MVIVLDQPQHEWDTVESLVLAAQEGNRDAYGELIQRFESSVYAIVYRRLRNDAEA